MNCHDGTYYKQLEKENKTVLIQRRQIRITINVRTNFFF